MDQQKRWWLPALLLFLVFGILLLVVTRSDPAKMAYQSGLNAASADDQEAAISNFSEAIRLRPDFAAAYYERADIYLALGRLEESTADYQQAVILAPEDAPDINPVEAAYQAQGDKAYDEGNYQQSLDDYSAAIALSPNNNTNYNNRGLAYNRLGRYEQAVADFSHVIELAQTTPETINHIDYTYLNRASSYTYLGRYEEAIADYSKAVDFEPDNPAIYNNRGLLYGDLGQADAALADFNRALELDPAFVDALINRSVHYSERYGISGNYLALDDLNSAIDLAPDKAAAYEARATVYSNLKDHDAALADFNRSIAIDPNKAGAYRSRGLVLNAMGDAQGSVDDFNRAIELAPDSPILYTDRGNSYGALGEYDLAIADFQEAIELNPDMLTAYLGLAQTYRFVGDFEQVVVNAKHALELADQQDLSDEIWVIANHNLAIAYTELGNYEQALEIYDQLLSALVINPAFFLGRGDAYAASGEQVLAAKDYSQWLSTIQTQYRHKQEIRLGDQMTLEMQKGQLYSIPFSLDTGKRVNIYARTGLGATVDPLIIILDHAGKPLLSDNHSGGGVDSAIQNFSGTGNYILMVGHAAGGSDGTIIVTMETANP